MKLRENESNTPKAVLQREHIEIERASHRPPPLPSLTSLPELSRLLARSQAA